jgi:glycosyltransferase involved in cell wall biosynthesis
VIVDWHEVWTRDYWRDYLGRVGGAVGWSVQRACARIGDRAFCFSRLHAARLREEGFKGGIAVLEGEYDGDLEPPRADGTEPVVVFAGRHIPEKRVPALVPALALAREQIPGLRGEIYGDGPDRPDVLRAVADHGLGAAVDTPGFVDGSRVEQALARALCMVLPSRREGYGLVVIEAASRGTPSVVVADPDSAATELVEEGRNGVLAASASPEDLAAAILRVRAGGQDLRRSTAQWFAENAQRLSLESSLRTVLNYYAGG